MPAPTLYQLYAYEEAIEPAFKAILAAAPFSLNAQLEFSDGTRVYPLLEVQLRSAVAIGQKYPFAGKAWPNGWKGQLVFRISTVRGKSSDQQGPMLGKCRTAVQQCTTLITASNLPWHAIDRISETGLSRGVDPQNNLDVSELASEIVFNIQTAALVAALS